ncbi:response regulator [Agitococcus lubricus]|uniref:Two-component system response regulator BaeR n=1 Tax=Agitococcus lubricus TaxID=1077255 RepID=A0A2T5J0Q8_9GAMM|nr:response regulator [Agitococcus lubricus]PTQ89977.1 two-component system response regulator BaeR [Agitococcus lubricus]
MTSVVLVEDEQHIADIEIAYLKKAGLDVTHFVDGEGVVAYVRDFQPQLVILDIMVPYMSGTEICQAIRQFSAVPIIMITARAEEVDRLLGFELGADDYLCKPFSPKEMIARVTVLLRRSGALSVNKPVSIFDNDPLTQRIQCRGQRLDLTPQEYRLLSVLMSHPSRIFSRGQLLQMAYEDDSEVFDRAVDSHIKNLRKKIATVMGEQVVIHSVYGVGYRFEVE